VAGVPSEAWGEEVTAFVVLTKAIPVPSKERGAEVDMRIESELIAFARERLATYKCPRRVIVIDQLPRNAMGKVERSRLRTPAQAS